MNQFDPSVLQSLLPKVLEIAQKASAAILEVYQTAEFKVTYKDDESPLTLADCRSDEIISKGLAQLTPGIPVISEEAAAAPFEVRRHWSTFWLVDPLDGTKEFVSRNGEFTVNIGLIHNRQPVLGVLLAPALQTVYFAFSGGGAFKKTSSGNVQEIRAADYRTSGLIVAASRSHDRDQMDRLLAEWKPVKVLNVGSALKMALVAEGAAHFYPRIGPTMEWDTAASHCIVNESGGSVTQWNGEPFLYNKADLTNPGFLCFGNPPYKFPQYPHL